MDVSRYMPVRKVMPSSKGGQLNESWKELDRATMMAILAKVRENYSSHMRVLGAKNGRDVEPGLRALEAIRLLTLEWLSKVPDELFRRVPDGETWSCHDFVNHLADDEESMYNPGEYSDWFEHRILCDAIHLRQIKRIVTKLNLG